MNKDWQRFTLIEAVEFALDAVAKYPEHPLTASEVILRNALRKEKNKQEIK